VQLTTVVEEHPHGRSLIRVRLRPRWSFETRLLFCVLAGSGLLALGVSHWWTGWRWLLLLAVLPGIWFLRREARHLQSLIITFLDEAAKEWGLRKLVQAPTASAPEQPAKPA